MLGLRPRRGPLDESRYRARRTGTAEYFTSRRHSDGLDVVVRRYPSSAVSGPAFVLVHGLGVSSRYFQPAAAELAREGEVYLVDLPGFGSAPNPKRSVSLSGHAHALAAAISELGLVNPVIVGHSMGSQVVSILATDFPDLSDRIVLMAPTMDPRYRSFGVAAVKLLSDISREPFQVKVIAGLDYLFRCGLPYLLRQVPYLLDDRIEERMPGIRARVLIMRGDSDVIVPSAWARTLTNLTPQAKFVEVVGPHVVMFTDPVAVARQIVVFTEL